VVWKFFRKQLACCSLQLFHSWQKHILQRYKAIENDPSRVSTTTCTLQHRAFSKSRHVSGSIGKSQTVRDKEQKPQTLVSIRDKRTTSLDFELLVFKMPSISWIRNMADIHRLAAIEWSNTLTLRCLACHVTATSQLLHNVNKFLLAYVILFKRVNFWQCFVSLRESIFNCCNVLMSSWS